MLHNILHITTVVLIVLIAWTVWFHISSLRKLALLHGRLFIEMERSLRSTGETALAVIRHLNSSSLNKILSSLDETEETKH